MSNRPGHSPFLVVLSSPSGAGKTSIYKAVLRRDKRLAYSVSATTRLIRKGEVRGRSYLFYTEAQFRRLLERNELLEHATVYDHSYGTPRAPVERCFRRGFDVIADLDIQGMRSCKEKLPGTVSIFITVSDRAELGRRLKQRGTDAPEVVARRQAELDAELAAVPDFDYIVRNDRLEDAVRDVMAIIRAERLRTSRMCPDTHRPVKHQGGS
jgi:guanylate kinase